MTDAPASTEATPGRSVRPQPGPPIARRRAVAAAALLAVVVLAAILGAGLGGDSGAGAPATGAASIVPADALAYVNVSLDRGRPSVRRALAIAGRFGDFRWPPPASSVG